MTNGQYAYAIMLMILLIATVLMVYKNCKDKNITTRMSILGLASGFSIVIIYMINMIIHDFSFFLYNAYGILQDVLMCCLLTYASEIDEPLYNKKANTIYKQIKYSMIGISFIDSCFLIAGCMTGNHLFLLVNCESNNMLSYGSFSGILHNSLIFTLMFISCFIFSKKRITIPSFYREPYNAFICVTIYIAVCELCHLAMINFESINLSIIGFPIEGVLMHYYSTQHRLDSLIRKSNDAVMDALNDGFILLDKDKKIIYNNRSTKGILPTDYEWESFLDKFGQNVKNDLTFTNKIYTIKPRNEQSEEKFIDVSYQTIHDERDKYVGSYFLLHDATASEKSHRRSDFMAKHNALTGLYNKIAFCEKSKDYIKKHFYEEYIIVLFDIDRFKMINELFGNDTGDNILCELANAVRTYMLHCDGGGVYGHLGDDRFVMLLRKDDFDEKTFSSTMTKHLMIEQDKEYKIIIHAGVCDIDIDDFDENSLNIMLFVDRATLALADIKGDMQKSVAWYGPHITKTIIHQQKVISEVDKALEDKNICFFVQPQTDINGKSYGGEALVRWIDPKKGVISPGEFVPILEDKGLISKVDLYIWDLVCQKLKEWKDKNWTDYYLSVNISAKDMYYMNIYDEFTALVNKYGIKPSSLRLEVTESAVMMDKGRQFELLEKLRTFGFMIEIDDFGSGYSSLNMLKDIEFDMLKIDMAFLKETSHVEKSRKIIQSIIQMAKCIGTDVITEGVETLDQLEFLNSVGCDNFQGYYFDKPLSVDEFEKKYLTHNDDTIGG